MEAAKVRVRCCYCNIVVGGNMVSRDHIMPRHRNGAGLENNTRKCCVACNTLKEHAGDCIGALACASTTAESLVPIGVSHPLTLLKWRNKGKDKNGSESESKFACVNPRCKKYVRKVLLKWKLMHGANE